MLKGRGNYLCTRRLQKAMQHGGSLFTSSEGRGTPAHLRMVERPPATAACPISRWSRTRKCGRRSAPKAALCSAKKFAASRPISPRTTPSAFFNARGAKCLSSDVLVLNHTLFFTLLGTVDEEADSGGILFKNDFVIFDEAHTMESVASRHIGLSVSHGQVRYALNRLWNPRTQKGLLATFGGRGKAIKLVVESLQESDEFFADVEQACEEIQKSAKQRSFGAGETKRGWTELRIRRPELVKDSVSLPIQRLRESISELIKMSDDKEAARNWSNATAGSPSCARRSPTFLGQNADRLRLLGRARRQGAQKSRAQRRAN